MKPLLYALTLSRCLFGCGQPESTPPSTTPPPTRVLTPDTISKQIATFQPLVERSLVVRSEMLRIVQELKLLPDDTPLSSAQLMTLKEGSLIYLDLRSKLYAFVYAHEALLYDDRATSLDPAVRLKAVMLSTAAALTLYDNYLLAIVVFEEDDRLRRLLNDPDSGFGIDAHKLDEITLNAQSIEKRERLRTALTYCEARIDFSAVANRATKTDLDSTYLATLIARSPSYNFAKKIHTRAIAIKKFEFMERASRDFLLEVKDEGVNLISLIFGNTVGLYADREGKLYNKPTLTQGIASQLKPLDILLEKTPFRLTDRFIPGHFGHVAIWLGTEQDLRQLGIWEHPVVAPHHALLRSTSDVARDGHCIVEALRSGVQLSPLSHFLNVDDFAIIRPTSLDTPELEREALLMAFRQIGKDYDFNFDINTTDKIVCSELAYISFPSIDWPSEATLGRHTISPDQVARQAYTGNPLELVMFYHDGVPVPHDKQTSLMRTLIGAP